VSTVVTQHTLNSGYNRWVSERVKKGSCKSREWLGLFLTGEEALVLKASSYSTPHDPSIDPKMRPTTTAAAIWVCCTQHTYIDVRACIILFLPSQSCDTDLYNTHTHGKVYDPPVYRHVLQKVSCAMVTRRPQWNEHFTFPMSCNLLTN